MPWPEGGRDSPRHTQLGREQTLRRHSGYHIPKPVVTIFLSQWSPTFLAPGTDFMEGSFSMDHGWGDGFRMI